jgi:hypothetical protein
MPIAVALQSESVELISLSACFEYFVYTLLLVSICDFKHSIEYLSRVIASRAATGHGACVANICLSVIGD